METGGKKLYSEVGFSTSSNSNSAATNGGLGLATLTAPSILRSASPSFKPQRVTTFAPTVEILEDNARRRSSGTSTLSPINSSEIYDEIDGLVSEGSSYRRNSRNSSSDSIRNRYVQNLMEDVRRENAITEDNIGKRCWDCECPSGYLPHEWRKTCKNCKCPRDAHDLYHDEWITVRNSLGLAYATDPVQRLSFPRTYPVTPKGFSWAPPNLPIEQVEIFYKNFNPDKVPRTGTAGELYRDRQLSVQIPKQDLALAYSKHVKQEEHSAFETFVEARNEVALDVGFVAPVTIPGSDCPTCRTAVPVGKLAVFAPKVDDSTCWHPHCFTCSYCNEHLVDLTYCKYKGTELYCVRHYAEKMKRRCAACDELIFSGEFTSAMNKDFHPQHFCCWQCDESLSGKRYVLRDEHPYCVGCYEAAFANTCDQCNQIIGIGSKDLSYKDKHWHEACFYCFKCRLSLVDRQFGSKADKIYCSPCYEAQFAARCDACGDVFKAGTKKMEYKTRQWHEKCFACCVCKTPIGTKSFIPREQEIYCAGCYEEKFATRCVKCNKVITSGGVTYKNDPWHRSCFTCTHCNIELAGQRFTSKDDKPYCADCYGELFAKRCFACAKPITGIGGTRFISFEERHWHNDCFICAMCKTSLVGRGFIADSEDIICPDCAKSKLM